MASLRPRSGPMLSARPLAGSGDTSRIGYSTSRRQRTYTHLSVRFSARLPGGCHSLISRFSSTSAPSSELVGL